ncbi:MAG: hypothetical protein SGI88_04245 [Candidatus Hydrogenedentes bacterium]|nr:hypothetical protein [Candidatus Hydrogenedentota bacterium]
MHIAARMPETVAMRRLSPGIFRRARIALNFRRMPGTAALPKLEIVWLPRHLFDIRCVLGKDEHPLTACVDSYSGMFTIFEMDAWVVDGDAPGPVFSASMNESEAEAHARAGLLAFILRQRGSLAKPEPRDTVRVRLIHYPYWVYYFDAGGYINIRAIDAVTGEKGGGKVRRSLLNAFVETGEIMATKTLDEKYTGRTTK